MEAIMKLCSARDEKKKKQLIIRNSAFEPTSKCLNKKIAI